MRLILSGKCVWKLSETSVIHWQPEPVLASRKLSLRGFICYQSLKGRDRDQVVGERMAEGWRNRTG